MKNTKNYRYLFLKAIFVSEKEEKALRERNQMAKKKAKELEMIGTRNYEAEKENCKIKKFLCVFEAAASKREEKG